MPYQAPISRSNPTLFVIMIDQSGSMIQKIPRNGVPDVMSKAEAVTEMVNRIIQELVLRCTQGEEVLDYFEVALIGYSTTVGSAFQDAALKKRLTARLSEIANHCKWVEEERAIPDGAGGTFKMWIKVPHWAQMVHHGLTEMNEAFALATRTVEDFIGRYPNAFPPTVVNITDGESSDGSPSKAMDLLKSKQTSDGAVMLFNVHVSSQTDAASVQFPSSDWQPPDSYARIMCEGASEMHMGLVEAAQSVTGLPLQPGAKAFVLNADMMHLTEALDIGTYRRNW